MLNIIVPNKLRMVKILFTKREFHLVARARVGWGKGDYSFFSLFGPAVRSQKILAVPAVVETLTGRHSGERKRRG